MSSTGSHLVDLNALASDEISDAIISSVDDLVLSRFSDNIWEMSPYLLTKNNKQSTIRFDCKFHDGSCLTSLEHCRLLDAAKRFLYARWRNRAPHSRKYVSARTVVNNWAQLRALLKWMVVRKIKTFGQLTSRHCLEYAASQKGRLKRNTQIINLQILTLYYDLRNYLTDPLVEYPWGNSAPIVLVGNTHITRVNGVRMATTEIIPSRLLRIIVQKALAYVESDADNILMTRDHILEILTTNREKLLELHRHKYPDGFSSIYRNESEYLAVRLSHISTKEINRTCVEHGFALRAGLKKELIRLRTACYIICAVFSGMRDSELASLEVGCFSKQEGFDNEIFCWLRGLTYKLERDPMPAQWMVPEVVGKAVDVATRLGAPERAGCFERIQTIEATLAESRVLSTDRSNLLAEIRKSRKHQHALMFSEHGNDRIQSLGGVALYNALHDFVKAAGAIVEPSDMEGVVDRNKVCVGDIWPLSPHQFRRTFAVFVARNLLGDFRYLREHFKHWSIDMTLYYMRNDQGVDATVFSEVLTERDELQSIILEKWIQPDSLLSGGGGKRIIAFRNRSDVKTVNDMRDFCRKLGEDVYVRGTGHSWCMASGSGCGGLGLYDIILCASCGEGVIDETHLQLWRGVREQQIEVLQCPDIGAPSWQRCVTHLRKAEKILSDLGETITPYPVPPSPLEDIVIP